MLRKILVPLMACSTWMAHAQINIELVGHLSYQSLRNSQISNLWGYTDEAGNEYAIVGVNGGGGQPGGVSVVSLADPANPQEVFFHPGLTSIWREVKVWGDHAYITTEAPSGGITIVDLSPLPESTDLTATVWQAPGWTTSHSLFIDENGRLYIHGANRGNGGVIMYDLTQDPWNPVEVGTFDTWYCHDSFARGDTLYAAHIYDGFFSIVDVGDPASPVLLGTHGTPYEFTHNTWLDGSGQYLYTTDERSNAYVAAYDVSDPSDIQFKGMLRSDNGSGAVPHNTYWVNDNYLVTSYYTYGVAIYDATLPHNLVEVGSYDTSPLSGDGFNGAWGVYPFFPSGRLIISDIEQGLFVLEPTYVRACLLEGVVRNATTQVPVGGATVVLQGTGSISTTGINGNYATGYHLAGAYTVTVSAPGFEPKTITDVQLVNGEVTTLDIDLVPVVPFALQGLVVDASNQQPLPGAMVRMTSPVYAYEATSGGDGTFTIPNMFADDYALVAGKWGWRTICPEVQSLSSASGPLTIALDPGYYDDFELDFGWTVSSTATAGHWERGVPVGTTYLNSQSNPGTDASGDCGEQAYVTGNGGGEAGSDDVDSGNTVLISPVFDATTVWDPGIRYHRWFYNGGGSGAPNDRMRVWITNGTDSVQLEQVQGSGQAWVPRSFRIADHLAPTPTMRLIVEVVDNDPGHLVEGGFDRFEVVELSGVGVEEIAAAGMGIWPNPANDHITVTWTDAQARTLDVIDATGRRVFGPLHVIGGRADVVVDLPAGLYFVRLNDGRAPQQVQRLVVAE